MTSGNKISQVKELLLIKSIPPRLIVCTCVDANRTAYWYLLMLTKATGWILKCIELSSDQLSAHIQPNALKLIGQYLWICTSKITQSLIWKQPKTWSSRSDHQSPTEFPWQQISKTGTEPGNLVVTHKGCDSCHSLQYLIYFKSCWFFTLSQCVSYTVSLCLSGNSIYMQKLFVSRNATVHWNTELEGAKYSCLAFSDRPSCGIIGCVSFSEVEAHFGRECG